MRKLRIYNMMNSEKGVKMKINKKFMQKLAAVITAAAVVLPSYAIYADPDDSEEVTGSGLVDVIENQEEDAIDLTNSENGAVVSASFEDYAANSPYNK